MYRIGKIEAFGLLKDGYKIRITNDYKYQVILDTHSGERNTIMGWIASGLVYHWIDIKMLVLEGYNSDGRYYILKEAK